MNKDEIEAMGKFFKQAFDMSNGSPPDVKYEMTEKAKDALKEIEKRIDNLVFRDAEETKRATDNRNALDDRIDRLTTHFKTEMDRLRKDYRELQQEVLDDFIVIKDWIIATQSSDKERIRQDLLKEKNIRNRKKPKSESQDIPTAKIISHQKLLEKPVAHLELSVRSLNVLAKTNIKTLRQLIQYSYNEIRAFRGLGRMCAHEIYEEVKKHGLELAYKRKI